MFVYGGRTTGCDFYYSLGGGVRKRKKFWSGFYLHSFLAPTEVMEMKLLKGWLEGSVNAGGLLCEGEKRGGGEGKFFLRR